MDPVFSKKRGMFLTVIIFLSSLSLIRSLFPNPSDVAIYENLFIPSIYAYYSLILLNFIALWGVWLWKKKAVYMVLIIQAVDIVLSCFPLIQEHIEHPNRLFSTLIAIAMIFFLYTGLFLWAVKRKWKYFR